MRFPAIVVRQPWASLLVAGIKDVENRRFRTRFTALIVVAGQNDSTLALPSGCAIGLITLDGTNPGSEWAIDGWQPWRVTSAAAFGVARRVRGMPGIFETAAAFADVAMNATRESKQLGSDHDLSEQLAPLFGVPDWLISLRAKPRHLLLDYARPGWTQKSHHRGTEPVPLMLGYDR